jgi:acyl-CoA thioesterase FadM
MTTAPTALDSPAGLLAGTTTVRLRPRFEGCNICTWIGFKHVNYLVEEAMLEHFRAAGLGPGNLYERYGLALDVTGIDTRITHALHIDDVVEAQVRPRQPDGERAPEFRVILRVSRGDVPVKAVTAMVSAALRPEHYIGPDSGGAEAPPSELACYLAAAQDAGRIGQADGRDAGQVLDRLTRDANAFGWKWRIPYIYCHFNERLQMSGYLRQMEETVDLFLADRGISIKSLLDDRRWIPVVPHSKIQILGDVFMQEDLYTVYTVEEVLKNLTYTSRMDCYVVRDEVLIKTATGTITHGYAVIESRHDWRLVGFDDLVLDALSGHRARPGTT